MSRLPLLQCPEARIPLQTRLAATDVNAQARQHTQHLEERFEVLVMGHGEELADDTLDSSALQRPKLRLLFPPRTSKMNIELKRHAGEIHRQDRLLEPNHNLSREDLVGISRAEEIAAVQDIFASSNFVENVRVLRTQFLDLTDSEMNNLLRWNAHLLLDWYQNYFV